VTPERILSEYNEDLIFLSVFLGHLSKTDTEHDVSFHKKEDYAFLYSRDAPKPQNAVPAGTGIFRI